MRSQPILAVAALVAAMSTTAVAGQHFDTTDGPRLQLAQLGGSIGGGGSAPAAAGGGGGGGGSVQSAPSMGSPAAPPPPSSGATRQVPRLGGGTVAAPQAGPGSDRRAGRHSGWRDDGRRHRRDWRHRDRGFTGFYVAPSPYVYGSACHRHVRPGRVMRHCHAYNFYPHRHGRWH
jgi:hypothetical protein